jgi:hypothetical protein
VEKPAWIDDVTWARLGKKLDPSTMHGNLLQASLFLTVFELLRSSVTMAPAVFELPMSASGEILVTKFEKGRLHPTPYYLDEIREFDVNTDYYRGGALWLGKMGVLTASEGDELLALRTYRNEVAHELAAFLVDIDKSLAFDRYVRLIELLQKVDRWRIRIDIDRNENYDGQDIKDEDIHSGSMMLVDVMDRMILRLGAVDA